VFVVVFPLFFLLLAAVAVLIKSASGQHLAVAYVGAALLASLVVLVGWKGVDPEPATEFSMREGVSLGFPILALNFGIISVLAFDKIAASALFGPALFAIYSFAGALLALINSAVLGGARVMLPNLSEHASGGTLGEAVSRGVRGVATVWIVLLVLFYPLEWIVLRFVPHYVQALPITRIMFVGSLFLAIPQVVLINAARAVGLARTYMKYTWYLIAGSLPVALLAGSQFGLTALAYASVLTAVAWTLLGVLILKRIQIRAYDGPSVLAFAWATLCFALTSTLLNLSVGLVAYVGCACVPLAVLRFKQHNRGKLTDR
jgi:O-antigen/teichoic acid export membrane protein